MIDIKALYGLFLRYPVIATDSRQVSEGSIFFALKGENFDGNDFVPAALEVGAAYAIADNPALGTDDRVIVVDDVLSTLQQLAWYHRKELGVPILAITGSNGKTTTKELVSRVLAKKYKISVTKGNLNNHIGVPLSLLAMDKSTQFGIVEMGTNHFGEIATLCRIACPNYGLITNVGKAHLEFFGSLEGVEKAKGELYDYLSTNKGVAFYNSDNPILSRMIAARTFRETVAYNRAKLDALLLPADNDNPFLRFTINGGKTTVNTQLVGDYNIDNVLAALTMGLCFGVPDDEAIAAVESYRPDNNRSQLVKTTKNYVYMDAYNANPTSMEASLLNFSAQAIPNKLLVLGDMRELGNESDVEHSRIADLIKHEGFTDVILVGTQFGKVANGFKHFPTTEELCSYLKANEHSGYSILVKGSRGMRLEKVLEYL